MLQRTGEAETITTHYLAALGVYRALYIPNWVYRFVLFSFVLSPPPCLLPPVSLLELFVVGLGGVVSSELGRVWVLRRLRGDMS
jgi:ER lumen protein retaining receptor